MGRLAPSPTGHLHLGHAWAFVLAWWSVRSRGGTVRLRLEDLDGARARSAYADATLRDLEWLGLDWDGPVERQTDSLPRILSSADDLERRGAAFPCVCTRGDVRAVVGAPQAGDGPEPPYPGTCRGIYPSRRVAAAGSGKLAGLRFRVKNREISFVDGLAGDVSTHPPSDGGDFLIVRRDGVPSYQLAVVVDDGAAGVTEVLRGEDLLSSTGRQILLQEALGLPHPAWLHVPLVVDGSGRRLAKRHDDLSLTMLREAGVDPRAVIGWVARAGGQVADDRPTATDLVPAFDRRGLGREPVVVDEAARDALFAAT